LVILKIIHIPSRKQTSNVTCSNNFVGSKERLIVLVWSTEPSIYEYGKFGSEYKWSITGANHYSACTRTDADTDEKVRRCCIVDVGEKAKF